MSRHTIIIAEAGVNHNGSIELAKQLVDKAVEAGVDYIKFQSRLNISRKTLVKKVTASTRCLRSWSFLLKITKC